MNPNQPTLKRERPLMFHYVTLAFAALLLFVAFAPTLRELVAEWILRPEYSHGFLMPLVAGWMVWERRGQLRDLKPRPSLWGAIAVLGSVAFLLLGEMKLSWFLKPYAFVAAVGGVVWAFYGWRGVRATLPVLVVLLLMCPLPGRVQRDLTLPLKRSAALFATGLLDLSGIHATLEGNLIHIPGIDSLWVADACSGIRSLISLVSLAILACFVWKAPAWMKACVVAVSIPIAVFANGMRIALTGILSVRIDPEVARGFYHFFEGFVLFGFAALLLAAWAWLISAAFGRVRETAS